MPRETTLPPVVEIGLGQAHWAWHEMASAPKGFGDLAPKLPLMLRRHGLGQTMAYLLSRRGDGGGTKKKAGAFESSVEGWTYAALARGLRIDGEAERVMERIVEMDPDRYRRLSAQAVVLAEWLKRFAAGVRS